ncbi:MAG: tRNA lysidine(34) synthetase TilS, partial [Gemmobacter sp.]|nr:tRNA lysidine(34) synthetase TilS [Gemmobacter sp.]
MVPVAAARGLRLAVVTVDHGLRPEAANEAALVAKACAGLGIPHDTLHWQGWDGQGNISDRARRARYGLIAQWAQASDVGAVALGHTQDDVAETFLMRLSREAGLDGLAAMRSDWQADGLRWLRPMLGLPRAGLRDWLRDMGIAWADDPTNDDTGYLRVRARQALAVLATLGIDAPGLAGVADHLADARAALAACTCDAARRIAVVQAGDVLLDRAGLDELPVEIRRRLLTGALIWIASTDYGPRASALATIHRAISQGRPATLHGCRVVPSTTHLRLTREPRAVADTICPVDRIWDGRWQVFGPYAEGLTVRSLGLVGLQQCPDWRSAGLPRSSVIASPAVWDGARLVAAPVAGPTHGWRAEVVGGEQAFASFLLSH